MPWFLREVSDEPLETKGASDGHLAGSIAESVAFAGGLVEGEDALLVRGDVAAHVEALHRCGGGGGFGDGVELSQDKKVSCSLKRHTA